MFSLLVSDVCENICVRNILHTYPDIANDSVSVVFGPWFTRIKWLSLGLVLVSVLAAKLSAQQNAKKNPKTARGPRRMTGSFTSIDTKIQNKFPGIWKRRNDSSGDGRALYLKLKTIL